RQRRPGPPARRLGRRRPAAGRAGPDGARMNRLTRALATLAVAVVVLTGCGGSTGGTATDTTGAGYQAGDGSWTTWDQPDRTGPVELTGTTYDDVDVDHADWPRHRVGLHHRDPALPARRAP